MKSQITNIAELEFTLVSNSHIILLVTDCLCSTSRALVDKIEQLANKYPQYLYATVERKDVPGITGRLMVLVAPIVLVFVEGREVYRADRYVRMNELERALHQFT